STPTEESVKLCLRTQQVVAYESGVTKTVDPLGGSFYLEWLTDQLEDNIRKKMKEIQEVWGGMPNAVAKGFPQKEVLERAYKQELDIESGKRVIVGRNKYITTEKGNVQIQRPDEKAAALQKRRVKALKKGKRNSKAVKVALEKVRAAAADGQTNMLPILIEAVKTYATVGEITSVLKEVFGIYRDPGLVI
ncbi:MAG TPA: methylmalonyl-CoA mutase family protein, partial [Nitrososphaerales archaeon]|nr:methylmalonyl-CoA mutase family protein [Nitrososphaerales archaeon]